MTNDGENEEIQPMFGFAVDPVEMQRQQEQARMTVVSIRHGIDRMLEGLNKDDLASFRLLMGHIAEGENYKLAANFDGQATALLKFKFKVCGSCGVDHDQEFQDALAAESKKLDKEDEDAGDKLFGAKKAPEKDVGFIEPEVKDIGEALIEEILSVSTDRIGEDLLMKISQYKARPPLSQIEYDMMALYGLDDLWEQDEDKNARPVFIGFICKNCKMPYTSIQQRMLKSVDRCDGCFLKAAHG